MDPFKSRAALVTGGASGIGRALCEELGRRGASVVVTDINEAGAQEVANGIDERGGRAKAAYLDVTEEEAVRTCIQETAWGHDGVYYVFNNAGIGTGGEARDMQLEDWRRIVNINLWGVLHGTMAAYALMREQGFGHIVNTASMAGLVPSPTETAYAMTKHAIVGLSTSLREEARDFGVKVTVVCPGFIDTAIYESTTLQTMDWQEAKAAISIKMMDADTAARIILKGVARNREKIVFPFPYRVMYRLHRVHPALLAPMGRKMLKDTRALRKHT